MKGKLQSGRAYFLLRRAQDAPVVDGEDWDLALRIAWLLDERLEATRTWLDSWKEQ
ncbi:MAG: hypothetical protein ACQEVA_23655 [Myxococcota bacterium]